MAKSQLQSQLGKHNPFDSLEQEAYLNIQRTAGLLTGSVSDLLKQYDLSGPQYNILRILRGAGEPGLPSLEVGLRMVTRVPDVTRLVDRLESAGLAQRDRSSGDRRVVLVRITRRGSKLLARLDDPLAEIHRRLLGHMTHEELTAINRLMVKARQGLEPS